MTMPLPDKAALVTGAGRGNSGVSGGSSLEDLRDADVASVVAFLAWSDARWVSGAHIPVNGAADT